MFTFVVTAVGAINNSLVSDSERSADIENVIIFNWTRHGNYNTFSQQLFIEFCQLDIN